MYEKLVNLYKMKSTVMFRNFTAKKGEGGGGFNVMRHKPHLTFHRNTERMKMAATPLILPVSPFSLYVVVISLKTDDGFPNEDKK